MIGVPETSQIDPLAKLRNTAIDAEHALCANFMKGNVEAKEAAEALLGLEKEELLTPLAKNAYSSIQQIQSNGEDISQTSMFFALSDDARMELLEITDKIGARLPFYCEREIRQYQQTRHKQTLINAYAGALYEGDHEEASWYLRELNAANTSTNKFKLDKPLDLDALPNTKWVFHGLIPEGQVTIISSPGGLGKSRMALGLCVSIVTGRKIWDSFSPVKPGKALYLSAEDSDVTMAHRIRSYRNLFKFEKTDFQTYYETMICVHSEAGEDLARLDPKDKTVMPTAYYWEVMNWVRRERPRIVVVDTMADHASGINENDNGQVKQFMRFLKRIAIEAECSVVLVNHTRKLGEAGSTQHDVRGASSSVNSARAVFLAEQSKDRPGMLVTLSKSNLSNRTGEQWLFDTSHYALAEECVVSKPLVQRNLEDLFQSIMQWVQSHPGDMTRHALNQLNPMAKAVAVMQPWADKDNVSLAVERMVRANILKWVKLSKSSAERLMPGDNGLQLVGACGVEASEQEEELF